MKTSTSSNKQNPFAVETLARIDAMVSNKLNLLLQQLERIENKLDDMASIDMPMLEATLDFSSFLLSDLKINDVM